MTQWNDKWIKCTASPGDHSRSKGTMLLIWINSDVLTKDQNTPIPPCLWTTSLINSNYKYKINKVTLEYGEYRTQALNKLSKNQHFRALERLLWVYHVLQLKGENRRALKLKSVSNFLFPAIPSKNSMLMDRPLPQNMSGIPWMVFYCVLKFL